MTSPTPKMPLPVRLLHLCDDFKPSPIPVEDLIAIAGENSQAVVSMQALTYWYPGPKNVVLIVTDNDSLYPTQLAPATILVLFGPTAGAKHAVYGTEETVRLLDSDEVKVLHFLLEFICECEECMCEELAWMVFYIRFGTMSHGA